MSGVDTYFLDVSAHALVNIAAKGFFLKRKRSSTTKVNYVFFIILERSYFVQIHTFWKLVHVFFVHNILVAIGGMPPAGHFTLVFATLFGLIH